MGRIQGLPKFFGYPLLSQERVKLRTSNFVGTFIGSTGTKAHENIGNSGCGRSQGVPKIFRAPICRAHCAVIFAIAQLSCFYFFPNVYYNYAMSISFQFVRNFVPSTVLKYYAGHSRSASPAWPGVDVTLGAGARVENSPLDVATRRDKGRAAAGGFLLRRKVITRRRNGVHVTANNAPELDENALFV